MNRVRVMTAGVVVLISAAQNPPPPDAAKVIERIGEANAVILSGMGAGRLTSISTGVFVRSDGVLLTAYHGIKDAREVQVRLKNGEVFDSAALIAFDERRDVACIRITASKVAYLEAGSGQSVQPGETVYAVTSSGGMTWSATQGIVSAFRPSEEVPGAGQGHRLIQFTAPVAPGASGGALVDSKGLLVGIITRGGQAGAFAVPVESVIGLANGVLNTPLGGGAALQLPSQARAPASRGVVDTDPKDALRKAKTILVASKTVWFTPAALERELARQKDYGSLGLVLVSDRRVADLVITVDRPLFTYAFTFTVTDAKTSALVDAGKVTAIDGNAAAGRIAGQLVDNWKKLRKP